MKIQPINFKSNWRTFCYDDEMSKRNRQYIREHLEEPFQFQHYETLYSGRLEEYELNQLIKSLLNRPVPTKEPEENSKTDYELLKSAQLVNFGPLYGNNSYRASLNNLTKQQLEIIKRSGIKHIVDLRSWGKPIIYDGLDVCYFPFFDLGQYTAVSRSEEEYIEEGLELEELSRIKELTLSERDELKKYLKESYQQSRKELCDNFVKFIQTMQKENVLIGC